MSGQHDKGKNWSDGKTIKQVGETDGSYSEQVAANLCAWDATAGAYVKLTVDHATGNLNVAGGSSGGGGAVTVADGADVAQGATTDLSSANTVVGILKAIKAAVTGTLTVATHAVTQSGVWTVARSWTLSSATDSVNVGNFPATQPVSGSVSVSNFPATQPVSGTVAISTSPVHIDDNAGSLTVDAPVGTPVFARLSDGAAALVGQKTMALSLPVVVASDQSAISFMQTATGGANVLKTGSLVTTAVTADQVVLTYTVTTAKTFYLAYLAMYGRLTALSATASILGAISLETPSGTKVITLDDVNPTTSEVEFNPITFSQPIPIAAGVVVRVVVTPAATTSMTWRANFGGYEK